jgi:hypothetical protein
MDRPAFSGLGQQIHRKHQHRNELLRHRKITNLTETNEPLVQMLKELSVTGQKTAHDMYNATKGWVVLHS